MQKNIHGRIFASTMPAFVSLLTWYQKNARDLPWRMTTNPYLVWLSEVIMQQTRVEQGLPYYLAFAEKYPDVESLAAAPDNEVMKLWQGLGYYSRALNMLKTARLIVSEHGGKFPSGYDGLIALHGIGPYTAAAVASFAFGEPKAVVDGNVYRVLSRFLAIDLPINSTEGKKVFAEAARQLLTTSDPATHNQAMMELGATICKPSWPLCGECPLMRSCAARKDGTVELFPVKLARAKPKDRFLHYFFIDQRERTYIVQRDGKGIWKNLFELPNFETRKPATMASIRASREFSGLFPGLGSFRMEKVFSDRHQLTHQTIFADFYRLTSTTSIRPGNPDAIRVRHTELKKYAVPRLFDKFLNYYNLQG